MDFLKKSIIVILSLTLSIGVAEIFLRFYKPHLQFAINTPNLNRQEFPPNSFFPCLDSVIIRKTNAYGYSSNTNFSKNKYGIAVFGGSTTECISLDYQKAWPYLLENELNQTFSNTISLGNFGRASMHSGHHLYQVKNIPPQFENIRMIVILVGVNDFYRVLTQHPNYVPTSSSKKVLQESFLRYPRNINKEWFKRSEIWMYVRDSKQVIDHYKATNGFNKTLNSRVDFCQKAKKLQILPDLDLALNDYKNNLEEIIKITSSRKQKLVFLTQPTLWKNEMDSISLTYSYATLPHNEVDVYSITEYKRGMKEFNDVLLSYKNDSNVFCIDLAEILPRDSSNYYDFCHFNNFGSEQVKNIVHAPLAKIIKQDSFYSN